MISLDLLTHETIVELRPPVSASEMVAVPGSRLQSHRRRNLFSRALPTATAMVRGTTGSQLLAASPTRRTSPVLAASLGARGRMVASLCPQMRTRGRVARFSERLKVLSDTGLLLDCLAIETVTQCLCRGVESLCCGWAGNRDPVLARSISQTAHRGYN